jgi:hypothetical protein
MHHHVLTRDSSVANSLVASEVRRSLATLVILDSLLSTLAATVCEEENYA